VLALAAVSEGRRQLLFFAALALLLGYSFPHFEAIHSANELPRIYLTQAMVEDGTFAIDRGVERWGSTADVSPSRGHQYSNKAPGSSFLAVPGYAALKAIKAAAGAEPTLAEMLWVARMTTGVVPTLAFAWLLFGFLARFAPAASTRRLVVGAYVLGTMAMTYSVLFISHQLSAVCIATAYILAVRVVEDDADLRWMIGAGFAAGAAPLVDYQAAFAGVPIAIYVVARLVGQRRKLASAAALASAGAAVPIALLLFYHWRAFGSPWTTGYAASETFAHFHQKGFLGLDKFRIEALLGSMVSPDNGLLVFSPFLLWAVPGWVTMARQREWRAHALVSGSIVAIYVAFISSLIFWRGGWQMGPRYVTAMLPFAMIPLAVWAARVEERWILRGLLLATVLVGIFVYGVSCAEYPHFPEKFKNPLYEVTLRLLREGHAPYNAGWLIGLRGFASVVPYLLGLVGMAVYLAVPQRGKGRSALLGAVLAAAWIASYAAFPRGGPPADQAYERWVAGVMPS